MSGPSQTRRLRSGADTAVLSTKGKLDELMANFDTFEAVMKDGTRQRREMDENRLMELKHQMVALEKMLVAEIKRRAEINKSLQAWCSEQLTELDTRLTSQIHVRMDALQDNIDLLGLRVDDLEKDFAYEKERIPREIEERGRELTRRLTEFQELFNEEKQRRLVRESEIVKRLANHENEVDEEFAAERHEREQRYQELRDRLEERTVSRRAADGRFQEFVAEELAKIKNDIVIESVQREKEDDDIVETLTRYTEKLQSSLRIINSTTE